VEVELSEIENITVSEDNIPPLPPFNPSPTNLSTVESTELELTWNCVDPNNEEITFEIYFGTSATPPLVDENLTEMSYNVEDLEMGQTYYWRIIAWDQVTYNISSVWQFTVGTLFTPGEMILVEGGHFDMGDRLETGSSDELPVHYTFISSFYISKYEVTQFEYEELMDENPSQYEGTYNPVEKVNWYEAAAYCNKLSIQENLTPCYDQSGETNPDNWTYPLDLTCNWNANGYRLPTEAEWEYAARGGIYHMDNFKFSGTTNSLSLFAWFSNNSGNTTHQVGGKSPNQLGIYDMTGNVWEWCWDWYSSGYYATYPGDNPLGPNTGDDKVIRGGAFDTSQYDGSVSDRSYRFYPAIYDDIGIRVVRKSN